MATITRIANPTLLNLGFSPWSDRQPVQPNVDHEILDTDQMFAENSVPGSKVHFNRMRVGVNRDTNVLFIDDNALTTYPSIDIRRSVGSGSGLYIQTTDPAGFAVDLLGGSDTPTLHVRTTSSGASAVPVQLQKDVATSTNFYEEIELRGGTSPAVSVSIWSANNANPNGVLSAGKGDFCISSNGAAYINTDGASAWSALGVQDWQLLGSTVLGADNTVINVTSFPARKFIKIIAFLPMDTNTHVTAPAVTFNNDTAGNYAIEYSSEFGARGTLTNQTSILVGPSFNNTTGSYLTMEFCNPSTIDKWGSWTSVDANVNSQSSATPPSGRDGHLKYAQNTQVTRVDITETGGNKYKAGASLFIFGSST